MYGEVAPLDERRGDAGRASILAEDLPLLHLDQMPVPMMFDDLGVSKALVRNRCGNSWPAAQASSRKGDDMTIKLQ